jgi:hypothetical protein
MVDGAIAMMKIEVVTISFHAHGTNEMRREEEYCS